MESLINIKMINERAPVSINIISFALISIVGPLGTAHASEMSNMDSVIQSDLKRMHVSRSIAEMDNDLLSIKNGSERVTQLLFVVKQVYHDPELLSLSCALLFKQPIGNQGVNAVHLTSMTELYLLSIKSPIPFSPNREVIDDFVLQQRLLAIIASVLDVEDQLNALHGEMSPQDRLRSVYRPALEKAQSSEILKRQIQLSLDILDASERNSSSSTQDPLRSLQKNGTKLETTSARPKSKLLSPVHIKESKEYGNVWYWFLAIPIALVAILWLVIKRRI